MVGLQEWTCSCKTYVTTPYGAFVASVHTPWPIFCISYGKMAASCLLSPVCYLLPAACYLPPTT